MLNCVDGFVMRCKTPGARYPVFFEVLPVGLDRSARIRYLAGANLSDGRLRMKKGILAGGWLGWVAISLAPAPAHANAQPWAGFEDSASVIAAFLADESLVASMSSMGKILSVELTEKSGSPALLIFTQNEDRRCRTLAYYFEYCKPGMGDRPCARLLRLGTSCE